MVTSVVVGDPEVVVDIDWTGVYTQTDRRKAREFIQIMEGSFDWDNRATDSLLNTQTSQYCALGWGLHERGVDDIHLEDTCFQTVWEMEKFGKLVARADVCIADLNKFCRSKEEFISALKKLFAPMLV